MIKDLENAWGEFLEDTPTQIYIDPKTIALPNPKDLAVTILHECSHYAKYNFNKDKQFAREEYWPYLATDEGYDMTYYCFGSKEAQKPQDWGWKSE